MKGLRFSLQRYFIELRDIDIIADATFREANIVFDNVLRKTKEEGLGDTEHYAEIEPEDLIKLYSSFDTKKAVGLQEKVWFDVMYQLIRRGRENIRSMTKNTFKVGTDASGKRYIYQDFGEADKNHGAGDHAFDTTGEGRIYETDTNCPVKCFESYLSCLNPMCQALWQRPHPSVKSGDTVWFVNVPLGEKYLGSMMARLSIKYGFSQRYTNYCFRVTSLQVLDDNNVDARHTIRVSGHKQTDSLQNYSRRLSASRKRSISNVLSSSLIAEEPNASSNTVTDHHAKRFASLVPSLSAMDVVEVDDDVD